MRMRFYDRTEELQDLREVMRQSFDDHSRLTVLTGRRRIESQIHFLFYKESVTIWINIFLDL